MKLLDAYNLFNWEINTNELAKKSGRFSDRMLSAFLPCVVLATAGRQLDDNVKGHSMAYSRRRVANTWSNFSFLQ